MNINTFLEEKCDIKNDEGNEIFNIIEKNKMSDLDISRNILNYDNEISKNIKDVNKNNELRNNLKHCITEEDKLKNIKNQYKIVKKNNIDDENIFINLFGFEYFYFYIIQGHYLSFNLDSINFVEKYENTKIILKNFETKYKKMLDELNKLKELKIKEKEDFIKNKKSIDTLEKLKKEIENIDNKIVFENNFERLSYYDNIDKKKTELRLLKIEIENYENKENNFLDSIKKIVLEIEKYNNKLLEIRSFPLESYKDFILMINKNYKIFSNHHDDILKYRLILCFLIFINLLSFFYII